MKEMKERCRRRARELFGMEAMARNLEIVLREAVGMGPVGVWGWWVVGLGLVGLAVAVLLARR
jgi:alpha-1,3/alpha-1,6-mannosyltransferase